MPSTQILSATRASHGAASCGARQAAARPRSWSHLLGGTSDGAIHIRRLQSANLWNFKTPFLHFHATRHIRHLRYICSWGILHPVQTWHVFVPDVTVPCRCRCCRHRRRRAPSYNDCNCFTGKWPSVRSPLPSLLPPIRSLPSTPQENCLPPPSSARPSVGQHKLKCSRICLKSPRVNALRPTTVGSNLFLMFQRQSLAFSLFPTHEMTNLFKLSTTHYSRPATPFID